MAQNRKKSRASKAKAANKAIAERAQRVRVRIGERLGYRTQKAFAEHFLGISPKLWNHAETGFSFGIEVATLLCNRVPGLTLDWLYHGNTAGLPLTLAQELGAFENDAERRVGKSSNTAT